MRRALPLLLTACVPGPTLPSPSVTEGPATVAAVPVKKRTLEKDETVTTVSGATFTASAGWRVEERPEVIILTAPEGDLRLSYVEVAESDRDKAIAAAWKRVAPEFSLRVADAVETPARDGWDAEHQVVYLTSDTAQRVVLAVARRKGSMWFIALVDGSQAALDRRDAQVYNALSSLQVEGLEKESFAGKTANTLDAARIAELDRFIEEALVMANVPGASVAVVQDGAVVQAKGYGVKKRGAKGKVGSHTLFMIGSVGKSLTALMMARMIDEGRFGWDTPVTTVMPAFALGDAATTKRLEMRHMLCACTGIPSRPDIELTFEMVSAEERLAIMKSMLPTTAFGETFQYSDVMVAAGGFVAAHAYSPKKRLLPAYTEAMQALVFRPLGMKSTTFDFMRVARADHAVPHPLDVQGEAIAVTVDAERWTLPVAPAGAVWSSAHDMARYLAFELGTGKLGGEQIVSEQQVLARRAPQVKINDEASYGLAWGIGKRSGLDTIEHGGGTYGFSTLLQMFPEHGVGIVILANAGGADLFNSVVHRRFLELLFDGKAEAKDILATGVKLDADARVEALERLSEADPDWFDGLAGGWVAPVLGRIDLARDEQGVTLDVGEWKVTVGKRTGKDGTASLVTTGVPVVGVELVPRERDGRTVLVISSGQHEYVFERVK